MPLERLIPFPTFDDLERPVTVLFARIPLSVDIDIFLGCARNYG